MLSNLPGDLRYAARSARRNPLFTVVVVLTLAVGIGANTAMFSIVRAALLEPLPYKDPETLVYAQCTFGGVPNPIGSAPDYYDYRDETESFETLSALTGGAMPITVAGSGQPERANALQVTDDFFRTLGVPPAAGRWFTAAEGRPGGAQVVVVSERFARRRFGDGARAVGQNLIANDQPVTIVGVMPASFRFVFDTDLWTLIRRGEGVGGQARRFHNLLMVGRLKRGATLEGARRQVDLISKRLQQQYPDSNRDKALQLDPLQAGLTGEQRPRLLLLMGAVGLILLVACANVAGLLLARGAARQSEIVVRTALGADRRRLVGQLLAESVSLAVLAGALGCVLAVWLQRLLPTVTGLDRIGVVLRTLDWPVLGGALAISGCTGVLSGLAPALWMSSPRLADTLSSGTRTTRGIRLQGFMVTAQIALSLVLLLGAGLFVRSFIKLSSTQLGYSIEHVLTGDIPLSMVRYSEPARRVQFVQDLTQDLLAVPGVRAVGFVSHIPLRNPSGNLRTWSADNAPADPNARTMAHRRVATPGYLEAMQMPLLAGRTLAPTDREGTPIVLVINQLMARALFPTRSPIGQTVWVDMAMAPNQDGPTAFTVVGVIGDARIDAVQRPARPTMYLSYYQMSRAPLRLAIRSDITPESLTETVRRIILKRDPELPVDGLMPLTTLVGNSVAVPRVLTTTVVLFAVVAMLLASIGLYGTLSYLVSQRTREIGVRMALGASAGDVMRHVIGRASIMVVAGLGVGLGGAYAASRLVTQLLYEVTPTDPTTYVAATVGLALVGLGAAAGPAWRAAQVDPVQALRKE
jgi:putative ABC transport system permease protein